jgi:hypothetical protein
MILQPAFRHITHPSNPRQWDFFKQQLINQGFRGRVNPLLLRVFNKLTPTGSTFMVLLAIVDTTVFDDFRRVTARAAQG